MAQCRDRDDEQDGKSKKEKERKTSTMKERNKLRNWDPGWWDNQIRVKIMDDSSLVVNWLNV